MVKGHSRELFPVCAGLIWHRESNFDFHFDFRCQTQTDLSLLDINPLWSLFSQAGLRTTFKLACNQKWSGLINYIISQFLAVFKWYSGCLSWCGVNFTRVEFKRHDILLRASGPLSIPINLPKLALFPEAQILLQSFWLWRYPRIDWRRDQNIQGKTAAYKSSKNIQQIICLYCCCCKKGEKGVFLLTKSSIF